MLNKIKKSIELYNASRFDGGRDEAESICTEMTSVE